MKDFKIGDRVRFKGDGRIGEVFDIEGYNELIMDIVYWVRFPDGQEGTSPMQDLEFADPKTAFLTELQALMKRYNVTIDVDGDECALWLIIDIDGHAIEYVAYDYYTGKEKQTALTPDNIFNYDKE